MDFKSQPILSVERGENSLQSYFSKVYGYMANALAVSSVCAYLVTKEPLINLFYPFICNTIKCSKNKNLFLCFFCIDGCFII